MKTGVRAEMEWRMEIIRHCPVKIFTSTVSNMRYWYPYKLEPCDRASRQTSDTCLEYMLDSGIKDESLTNEDVIEKATELNATFVVPKDYLHNQKRTTESVREFFDLYENSDCRAKPVIPLQPPHDQHYEQLNQFSYYLVGGVMQEDPMKQLSYVKTLREKVGHGTHLHLLGGGASSDFVREIRNRPRLLDSLDLSTHERAIINGSVMDKKWEQNHNFDVAKGKDSSTVRGSFAQAMLLELNHVMSPLCDDEDFEKAEGQPVDVW